ncbi:MULTISPECIES: type II toxin-antitoxin system VapC family toxin [Spirulina sp. CCY15215]|uniref:type II toxin-antitoxin system VapC family toxin n=1 Tax=Spirulina sp. CCY15215 TaxID=2767591 RepID=UPI00194ED6A6|nr:type II toxin-antitoxin system VapC family toxin [Spirulina major]
MQAEVFLDTAYAIALTIKSDTFHERAIRLADLLTRQKTRLITTRPILLEIGNALSKLRYRHVAISLLRSLELDPLVEIVPLSETLYRRAFTLYCDRADKTWGLIDCMSFVVMQDRGITEALTTDEHFQQAGFRVLLREDI